MSEMTYLIDPCGLDRGSAQSDVVERSKFPIFRSFNYSGELSFFIGVKLTNFDSSGNRIGSL